jgi:hypothetical protein
MPVNQRLTPCSGRQLLSHRWRAGDERSLSRPKAGLRRAPENPQRAVFSFRDRPSTSPSTSAGRRNCANSGQTLSASQGDNSSLSRPQGSPCERPGNARQQSPRCNQLFPHVAGHRVADARRHRWNRHHAMDQSLVGGGRDFRGRVGEYALAIEGQQSTAPSLA